jgi:uncharacterized membrane protein YozB (DUF420 family)
MVREASETRRSDRQLFLYAAIGFVILVFIGFAPTYYLNGVFAAPLRSTTHIHGLVMTAWVALFVTQVYLIRSKHVKTHQRLGAAGVVLAAIVIIVGIATAIEAARFGSPSAPQDIPPLSFLIIPFGDMVIFAILFAAAIYQRRKPANHKRLMLVTVFNFLPPAIARIQIASLQALGPLWFFGFPDLLMLAVLVYDTRKNGRLNRAFALGALLVILSHPLRLMLMGTEPWLRFAAWMAG